MVWPGQITRCSGRVEIYYQDQWGTVCDDGWDLNEATLVCKQLDCGTAVSAPRLAHFGEGTGPVWLDDVACSGKESSLSECKHNGFGQTNCGHGQDAGVICSGEKTFGSRVCIKYFALSSNLTTHFVVNTSGFHSPLV